MRRQGLAVERARKGTQEGRHRKNKMAKDTQRKPIRRQGWRKWVAIKARVIRETKGKARGKGKISASRRLDRAPQKSRKPSCEVVSSLSLEVCKQGCMHL